jgi:hypothetical protein
MSVNAGISGCPKADAMLRQVDPYGIAQSGAVGTYRPDLRPLSQEHAPLHLQAYGWAQLDDGDWEFRDPSIPELKYLQSKQCWTTASPASRPHHYSGLRVQGRPDFVIGADGQVTAERGMYFHRPRTPFVVSQGRLTINALYGYGRSQVGYEPQFHLANPHLRFMSPDAPIPVGVRVHVPHHWARHLQSAGYDVHQPTERAGLGDVPAGTDPGEGAAGGTDVAGGAAGVPTCSDGSVAPGGDTSQCPEILAAQAALAQAQAITGADVLQAQTAAAQKTAPKAAAAPAAAKPTKTAGTAMTPKAGGAGGGATPPATTTPAGAGKSDSTPWIIGGVVGGAALLGVVAAVAAKKRRTPIAVAPTAATNPRRRRR